MAAALEIREIPEDTAVEEGIHYHDSAAKILAREYLINKRRLLGSGPEDAYERGKMEAREQILTFIGQAHLIHINRPLDPDNPPLVLPLKPVSRNELDKLVESYIEARQKSGNIRTLTPEEAKNRGIMIEIAKTLIALGQKHRLDELNVSSHQNHFVNSSSAELQ